MLRTINRDELRSKLQAAPGRVILVDVRDRQDFETEHIRGAISIPITELYMRVRREFGKGQEIIVYCGSFECPLSKKAAELIGKNGYENVLVYEGGLKDWKVAGFLTEVPGKAKAA